MPVTTVSTRVRRRSVDHSQEGIARAAAVRPAHRQTRHHAIRWCKLNPRTMMKNPVMFVVEVGAVMTTILTVRDLATGAGVRRLHLPDLALAVVHGAVRQLRRSHGGGPRQGAGRHAAQDQDRNHGPPRAERRPRPRSVAATLLRSGDIVIVEAGETIPGDGDVIEGIASVDESAITGESAPVIRESGGDRSAVTGGTKVLSDWINVRITSNPGETFLDRMIALVEGAQRQKTPNEIALNIVIAGLTLIFLLAVVTLQPFAIYSVAVERHRRGPHRDGADLAAGLPDPHHHRRTALRHRHRRHGPRHAAQRARHERQGRGGGRRRQHAAARQDRHDHARQPPGGGIPPAGRRERRRNWPTPRSSPASPTRRPRAAPSWSWPNRSTTSAAARWPRTRPTSSPSPRRRA